jgi:hypothetical protein
MNREGEHKRIIIKVSRIEPDIKTGGFNLSQDESIGYLFTGWMVSGIEMARARFRHVCGTARTRVCDVKGEDQVKKSKVQSTEAQLGGGLTRSSVEASVMGAEPRGQVVPVALFANSVWRMSS